MRGDVSKRGPIDAVGGVLTFSMKLSAVGRGLVLEVVDDSKWISVRARAPALNDGTSVLGGSRAPAASTSHHGRLRMRRCRLF